MHHNNKLSELDPTIQPTHAPTKSPTRNPTVRSTISPTIEATPSPTHTPPPTQSPPPVAPPSLSPTATAQPTQDPNLSSTGFFYLTNSFKSDCSSPAVSYGVPVGTCFADNSGGYAYVVRIVNGNFFLHLPPLVFSFFSFSFLCMFSTAEWSNAFIDFYSDKECQQLIESAVPFAQNEVQCQATSTPLVTNPLNPAGNVYSQLCISTSSTPPRITDAGGGLFE